MHRAYYDTLGVQPNASTDEIKGAYKKLARQKHPDKGGNEDEFKALGAAYAVLSDDNTRRIYDQLGEEGLQGNSANGFGNVNPHDIFAQFFGSDAGFGNFQGFNHNNAHHHHHRSQQPATVQVIECSLEELFTGCSKKVKITRKIAKGKAMSSPCGSCKGNGFVEQIVQMGLMVTQMRQQCGACDGRGVLKNKKLIDETTYVDLEIRKGTRHDTQIALKGKGNETPHSEDGECGDYILHIKQYEHAQYKRENDDLVCCFKITDVELVTCTSIMLEHIDSVSYAVNIQNMSDLSKPYKIANMGMPRAEQPSEFGDLFLVVNIEKTNISAETRKQVRAVLSSKPEATASSAVLQPAIVTRQKQEGSQRRNVPGRSSQPENVQCAQQ
jgi:DnaJ-class molecular chaperone